MTEKLQKSRATCSMRRVASFYYREIRSSMVRKYKQKTKTQGPKELRFRG